jgi:hypothetical protein
MEAVVFFHDQEDVIEVRHSHRGDRSRRYPAADAFLSDLPGESSAQLERPVTRG